MTILDLTPPALELSPTDARARAEQIVRQHPGITGADLGAACGRSERWGRQLLAELRQSNGSGSRPAASPTPGNGTGNGSQAAERQPVVVRQTPGNGTAAAVRQTGSANGSRPVVEVRQVAARQPAAASTPGNGSQGRQTTPATPSVPATALPARSGNSTRQPERQTSGKRQRQRRQPPPAASPAVRRVTTLAVVAVAIVAAIASYDHMRVLAEAAGEGWRSWLLPISVDGLIVAASMSMLVRRRAGLPAGALAWVSLLAGIAASLGANVAAADPTLVGRLVAAWPPVALLLSHELLLRQTH